MNNKCEQLHKIFNQLEKFEFSFYINKIPKNGVYIFFEKGEKAHNGLDRIVRVGSHIGDNQLRSRLKQHFIKENKDRSIFRKNIGRALLSKSKDSFFKQWELDLTTREVKEKYSGLIDFKKQKEIEKKVTEYIQNNFVFVVFQIEDKVKRFNFKSKIISTVSFCDECKPFKNWLGLYSPKEKIRRSGLWQVNELWKIPLSNQDMGELKHIIKK